MDKKAIIKALGDHFGIKPKYMGAPSFAYQFDTHKGTYTVDKEGKVTNPDGFEVELESLLSGSESKGVSSHEGVEAVEVVEAIEAVESPADPDPVNSPEQEAPAPQEPIDESVAPAEPTAPDNPIQQEATAEPAVPTQPPELTALYLEISVPLDGHRSNPRIQRNHHRGCLHRSYP